MEAVGVDGGLSNFLVRMVLDISGLFQLLPMIGLDEVLVVVQNRRTCPKEN